MVLIVAACLIGLQIIVMMIFAAVVGLIYFQLDDDYGGFQNRYIMIKICSAMFFFFVSYRIGAFFFILINVVFGNLSAVELFIKERPVFMYIYVWVHVYICMHACVCVCVHTRVYVIHL